MSDPRDPAELDDMLRKNIRTYLADFARRHGIGFTGPDLSALEVGLRSVLRETLHEGGWEVRAASSTPSPDGVP